MSGATQPTSETEPNSPQIGVLDLQNALKIIDAAAERGTFKGNELSAVGITRDRIAAFIAAVAPENQPNTKA